MLNMLGSTLQVASHQVPSLTPDIYCAMLNVVIAATGAPATSQLDACC
jgi:hypothetical protein